MVMAYYNRRQLLLNTLKSIERSFVKDIELIIVDDNSREEERIEDLVEIYPFIKVIRVEKKDKWYINTCMPMNRGIAEAKGDIIVLQNPECVHVQDVLLYIVENLTDQNYLSISTYAFNEAKRGELPNMLLHFDKYPQQRFMMDLGWYNHPVYRPVYFNFCAALTRKNMDLLGGFDERYAMGLARDDAEFVDRIGRLGLQKIIPTEVSVIHQWHSKVEHFHEGVYPHRIRQNISVYKHFTSKEQDIFKKNSYVTRTI
jgi:GT2 family glycosyltransferase